MSGRSGEWIDTEVDNRDFVWAQIDIPGSTDLFAISVHLLTSTATERNLEAQELVRNIAGLPAGAYVVLGVAIVAIVAAVFVFRARPRRVVVGPSRDDVGAG